MANYCRAVTKSPRGTVRETSRLGSSVCATISSTKLTSSVRLPEDYLVPEEIPVDQLVRCLCDRILPYNVHLQCDTARKLSCTERETGSSV